ncbi:MAG: diadenylate cyclase CdaA [Patescibacteria group bacterium]
MIDQAFAFLIPIQGFFNNFYLADFFDVFIITIFIYAALLLFKQTRSFSILVGIATIIVLYALAQAFHFYLTSLLLQSFFGAFLIVLVVIFQEELRRFFELIALWGTRGRKRNTSITGPTPLKSIVQAIANLAHRKIGALVILEGHENIERHIEGGATLDGVVSDDLLESIFDPTSPGHDGAVIIKENRLSVFGAHLPLSRNFQEIGKHGTRHSAALGISESSDALAIVVSEEHGTISIAISGVLTPLNSIEELEVKILNFFQENFPTQSAPLWETVIKRNSIEKLLAFCMSGLLWFFVAYQAGTVQRDFVVPISYRNLNPQLLIENQRPKNVTVTFSSRGNAFDTFIPTSLEISIDASTLAKGEQTIHLTEDMIGRPLNFTVANISPPDIQFAVTQYNTFEVPINVTTTNRVPPDYIIDHTSSKPDTIKILVSELIQPPTHINTTPIDLDQLTSTESFQTTLILPKGTRLPDDSPADLTATVYIRKR